MELLALAEILSCLYVGVSFIAQYYANDGAASSRRMRICSVLAFIWLFVDGLSYTVHGSFPGSVAILYTVNFLAFIWGGVTMIGFMWYCEACIRERTPLGRNVFRVPMAIVAAGEAIVAFEFFDGRLVTISEDGIVTNLGNIPTSVMVLFFVLLFYTAMIAFWKRRHIGTLAVSLIGIYCALPAIAVVLTAVIEYDLSVLASGLAVTIVAELLQNGIINDRRREAEIVNKRINALHSITRSAPWLITLDAQRQALKSELSEDLAKVLRNDFLNTDEWIEAIHPEDRDRVVKATQKALCDESGQALFDSEYRIRSREGDYHWVRSAGKVAFTPGTGGEMYGMCTDIDDTVKLHEAEQVRLQEAKAQERVNKAKSYFFSMVSHDIRTPLNAIIGYAELLKRGIPDEAERANAIDSVLVGGHTLLDLINDVLDLSKLEAGKMAIIPEPVDTAELVGTIVSAFRVSLGEKPVTIGTEVHPMPWLKYDPHRIRQILFNLVGNAVKFTEKGSITVSASYARERLRFEVRDTGCGISETDQKRIALPYVQVGTGEDRYKGTGLGLAICKQLVHRMDGAFELESQLGVGSVFRIVLPVKEATADEIRTEAESVVRPAGQQSANAAVAGWRVLVVDDQLMNRMVLKSMLESFGVKKITLAENGVDALEKLRHPFDLVLTDMWMPELDGEGLIREIRRRPEWKTLPVYAVTADVEVQKRCEGIGFTGLLLKPITLEKLQELVRTL